MHPREEARRRGLIEPGERPIDDLVARPLDGRQNGPLRLPEIEVVEVAVEPLGDTPSSIEHVGADEAAGAEAGGLEALGERGLTIVEKEAAVVADTVRRRVFSGEDRGVCRQRERRRRDRLVEENPRCVPI